MTEKGVYFIIGGVGGGETMKERLKQIRKELGMTQQAFADRLGIARGNIAAYEVGKNALSDAVISLICKTEFERGRINEDWLRNGVGEMFIQQTRDEQIEAFIGSMMADEEDSFKRRLISGLCALDETGWRVLENLLDSMQKKKD